MERRQHVFIDLFNIATILLWGWFLWSFLGRGTTIVSKSVVDTYLLILTFYAGDKEIHRWHHKYHPRHRHGEYFVAGWAMTGVLMLAIEILGGHEHGYVLPHELAFTVSGVLIIYFITEYVKTEFRRK